MAPNVTKGPQLVCASTQVPKMIDKEQINTLQFSRFAELRGLNESADRNGTIVQLLSYNEEKKRWKARGDGKELFSVKPENLVAAPKVHPDARCFAKGKDNSQLHEICLATWDALECTWQVTYPLKPEMGVCTVDLKDLCWFIKGPADEQKCENVQQVESLAGESKGENVQQVESPAEEPKGEDTDLGKWRTDDAESIENGTDETGTPDSAEGHSGPVAKAKPKAKPKGKPKGKPKAKGKAKGQAKKRAAKPDAEPQPKKKKQTAEPPVAAAPPGDGTDGDSPSGSSKSKCQDEGYKEGRVYVSIKVSDAIEVRAERQKGRYDLVRINNVETKQQLTMVSESVTYKCLTTAFDIAKEVATRLTAMQ
eukprot:4792888-Pyramimonas_sp.AAC.1